MRFVAPVIAVLEFLDLGQGQLLATGQHVGQNRIAAFVPKSPLRPVALDLRALVLRGPKESGQAVLHRGSFTCPSSLETTSAPHFGPELCSEVHAVRISAGRPLRPARTTRRWGATPEGDFVPSMDPSLPFLVRGGWGLVFF